MEAIPGEKRRQGEEPQQGGVRLEAMPGEEQLPGKMRPEAIPDEEKLPDERQAQATSGEKQLPHERWPETVPDSGRLAARLREETTELLALLPAARKAAAGGPAGGEAALDSMARAAYRVLRIAENMEACAALAAGTVKAVPICVTALAAAYVNGAAGVCRAAVFRPEWPREPLWSPGCARLFAAALGNLLANAVQYGGERPAVSVWARKSGSMLLLTVADNGAGYAVNPAMRAIVHPGMHPAAPAALRAGRPETTDGLGLAVVRQYAGAFGGQLLVNSAPGQGARFTLCLPLCAPGAPSMTALPGTQGTVSISGAAHLTGGANLPGTQEATPIQSAANLSGGTDAPFAPPIPPDYMADRFSPLYVQLAPVCDLPL